MTIILYSFLKFYKRYWYDYMIIKLFCMGHVPRGTYKMYVKIREICNTEKTGLTSV